MARFKDASGRVWDATLTVATLPVLRDFYGLELGRLIESEDAFLGLARLTPEQLVGVMWELCEPWREGETPESWAAGFDPKTGSPDAAAEALALAVIEFLPTRNDLPGADEQTGTATDRRPREPDLERDCWELAGVVGIDPRPFTMRQLSRMAVGRRRDLWDHTASVMATTLRTAGGEVKDTQALNPYWLLTTRPPEPSEEVEARRQADGWRLIETGLRHAARR